MSTSPDARLSSVTDHEPLWSAGAGWPLCPMSARAASARAGWRKAEPRRSLASFDLSDEGGRRSRGGCYLAGREDGCPEPHAGETEWLSRLKGTTGDNRKSTTMRNPLSATARSLAANRASPPIRRSRSRARESARAETQWTPRPRSRARRAASCRANGKSLPAALHAPSFPPRWETEVAERGEDGAADPDLVEVSLDAHGSIRCRARPGRKRRNRPVPSPQAALTSSAVRIGFAANPKSAILEALGIRRELPMSGRARTPASSAGGQGFGAGRGAGL